MHKPAILCLALIATCTDSASGVQPDFYLQADGHACSGYFRAHHGQMRWKSSFSVCDATYRATDDGAGTWTLHLDKRTARSAKSCSFAVVSVREVYGQVDYSLWEVEGFQSLSDLTSTPRRPALDCNMQSVRRTPSKH